MTIKITDQFILSTQGGKSPNKTLTNIFEQHILKTMPHSAQIRVYTPVGQSEREYVQR